MRLEPTTARALSGERSSWPTCTPSNPAARHKSARSFMIRIMASPRTRRSSRVSLNISRELPVLLRYWIRVAPPAASSRAYSKIAPPAGCDAEKHETSKIAYNLGNLVFLHGSGSELIHAHPATTFRWSAQPRWQSHRHVGALLAPILPRSSLAAASPCRNNAPPRVHVPRAAARRGGSLQPLPVIAPEVSSPAPERS